MICHGSKCRCGVKGRVAAPSVPSGGEDVVDRMAMLEVLSPTSFTVPSPFYVPPCALYIYIRLSTRYTASGSAFGTETRPDPAQWAASEASVVHTLGTHPALKGAPRLSIQRQILACKGSELWKLQTPRLPCLALHLSHTVMALNRGSWVCTWMPRIQQKCVTYQHGMPVYILVAAGRPWLECSNWARA